MKEILNELFAYKTLRKKEAYEVLTQLAQGAYNNSQIASFLTVFVMRTITVDELEGFRDAMLDLCIPVDLKGYDAIDLCGTGGDGKNTFNVSTLSSFIVAGAGQNVAKHGNNGVSSVCGSSNLLAHFGYKFTNDVGELTRSIEDSGICFLHAPLFHPAMKTVVPVRRELGIKTFFNMLGPMVNPSFPDRQLVGVFNLELARLYAYLYQKSDKQFAILHALDGYDEISLTGAFKVIDNVTELVLSPKDLGLNQWSAEALYGGETIEDSAKIFTDILEGKGSQAQNEVVVANSAMAIKTGMGVSLNDAVEMSQESLKSGKALETFKALLEKRKSHV